MTIQRATCNAGRPLGAIAQCIGVTFCNPAAQDLDVLISARTIDDRFDRRSARATPQVLHTLADVDSEARTVSLNIGLATRHGRARALDWLLRLDLARNPPIHEQWHGQAQGVGGQIDLVVNPSFWPKAGERWFLRVWLRDPSGDADWDLAETRALL